MGGARIPWYVVAVIHHMEGSSNFKTHLHNGDPLTGYTVNVPAGRPKVGHPPPFTWEESAVDSLKTKEHFDKITHWSLPVMLQRMESYNGAGYKNKKMTSPYLWAYSNHYTKGKYVKDGKFDAEAISKQLGAGVILKRMEERAIIYIPRW
jgi:lysozyme family protein